MLSIHRFFILRKPMIYGILRVFGGAKILCVTDSHSGAILFIEVIPMRDIGKNIKDLRQSKHMTQDILAEKLFVSRQTVSNYETGKSRPDVEMLIRIAEVLETDLNTVLYGTVLQADRRKTVKQWLISVAVLVMVWIGFSHLTAVATELAKTHYRMGLSIVCVIIGIPMVSFLFAWTAMETLGVLAKLSPVADPWGKRLRWTVLWTTVGYLFLQIPIIVSFIVRFDLFAYLPGVVGNSWYNLSMWSLGYGGSVLRPNLLLFGILGCALWLGIPKKK